MAVFGKKPDLRKSLLAEPFPKDWDTWLTNNLAHYPLLIDAERKRLPDDSRIIIWEKTWEGCDGLKVTDLMKLTIAAQAALLLLGLEHDYFSRVLSIVLFPTSFRQPPWPGEERERIIAGQAVNYGSVFLSWDMALSEARDPSLGRNLVIHEFAHQLDFLDGFTNGVPALRNRQQTQRWQRVMQGAYQRLRDALQRGEKTFLSKYAATNPTEFFSVVSENFFTRPAGLRENYPELFDVLTEYYRVDPLRWFEANSDKRSDLTNRHQAVEPERMQMRTSLLWMIPSSSTSPARIAAIRSPSETRSVLFEAMPQLPGIDARAAKLKKASRALPISPPNRAPVTTAFPRSRFRRPRARAGRRIESSIQLVGADLAGTRSRMD